MQCQTEFNIEIPDAEMDKWNGKMGSFVKLVQEYIDHKAPLI